MVGFLKTLILAFTHARFVVFEEFQLWEEKE